MLLNIFQYSFYSLQEHAHMFWLKYEGWSESNGHITTAPRLEALVSKTAHDLVTTCFTVAVDSTEGACTTSAVDQARVQPLLITA